MGKGVFKLTIFFILVFVLAGTGLFAQLHPVDLSISSEDLRLERRADEGFHLFIRRKPDISSVLLTESTRDPFQAAHTYAYRALEWNPINGDEIRLLDGFAIPRESRIFSLISSTPVPHPELGEAFHIFVPWVVIYGYEHTRHGTVFMTDGAFINIRAFEFPFADYRGRFADNPFVLQGLQRPQEGIAESYAEMAEASFREIARRSGGEFLFAQDPSEMIEMIEALLMQEAGRNVDIVICLDTTGSMGRYIDAVRRKLAPMMARIVSAFTDWRIGMVLYRDYPPDLYITRLMPFTRDFHSFQRFLNSAIAWGGGDIPEAVYEALFDAADKFPWAAESRIIILIGDAPPHPEPRGEITSEMVFELAEKKGIRIHAILLPE